MTCPDSPLPSRPTVRRARGFTLVEMLLAVGIAGIVASVAYPTYQSHARKTRQATSQEVLGQAQLTLEKRTLGDGRYPSSFAPTQATDLFDYSYSSNTGGTDYLLTATGKASSAARSIWSGINARGTRCSCRDCSAPASSTFTLTTTACPSGTKAY